MKRFPRLFLLAALFAFAGVASAKSPELPKAASPGEVAQLMAKPPAGLEVVDIRPPADFLDYSLPGSLNLDPAAVLADESLLSGTGPLLIIDKDGTRAFALAGALAQKGSRQIVVLKGGLMAWWMSQELGLAVKETPLTGEPSPASSPVPAKSSSPAPGTAPVPGSPGTPGSTAPVPATPAPQPPATKSAGC